MGAHDHRRHAEKEAAARAAVLTVSDSRTREDDASGALAVEILARAGHEVVVREIVPNDAGRIASAVEGALERADFVLTIGGTGPSLKDVTVEAVRPLLAKELPGFGELFRARSFAQIGSAAMLSRALLGISRNGRVVAALPGSGNAVRTALEEVLKDELLHLLWEVRRYA